MHSFMDRFVPFAVTDEEIANATLDELKGYIDRAAYTADCKHQFFDGQDSVIRMLRYDSRADSFGFELLDDIEKSISLSQDEATEADELLKKLQDELDRREAKGGSQDA